MFTALISALLGAFDWSFKPDPFPSVWFGANSSGAELPTQHSLETKYRAIYFGWQQSNKATGCRHEEAALRSQVAAVKNLTGDRSHTLAYGANSNNL